MDDFVADDFVEELLKKDDDATNIEFDGTSITYDTIVDIDPEEQLAPKLRQVIANTLGVLIMTKWYLGMK